MGTSMNVKGSRVGQATSVHVVETSGNHHRAHHLGLILSYWVAPVRTRAGFFVNGPKDFTRDFALPDCHACSGRHTRSTPSYFLVTFQMTSLPSLPAVETLTTSPLLPHSYASTQVILF